MVTWRVIDGIPHDIIDNLRCFTGGVELALIMGHLVHADTLDTFEVQYVLDLFGNETNVVTTDCLLCVRKDEVCHDVYLRLG